MARMKRIKMPGCKVITNGVDLEFFQGVKGVEGVEDVKGVEVEEKAGPNTRGMFWPLKCSTKSRPRLCGTGLRF